MKETDCLASGFACIILVQHLKLQNSDYFTACIYKSTAFNTYSMKTYFLSHFEHKNDVTVIVKLCIELRAVAILQFIYRKASHV